MQHKHMPKVTVIMPAYNAQEYIEGSVKSVLGQSAGNLELVVVNDGSSDKTAEILARLAAVDSRLRPITVENGGPARARNIALEETSADTDYIMFLDADDELLPDAIEYALGAAESGADLTIFGFTIVEKNGELRNYNEPEQSLSRADFGSAFARLYTANLLNQVWGKLYSARLIRENSISFPDYRWGEDRLFIFACLEKAEKICVLPEAKYRYIMHEGESLISRYYEKKFAVCLEIDEKVELLCRDFAVEDESQFKYMFMKSIFSCLTNLYSASCRLTRDEKAAVVKEIVGNERVRERSKGSAGGGPTAILAAVVRTGSVSLNLLAFRILAAAGQLAPKLFMKIKHRK